MQGTAVKFNHSFILFVLFDIAQSQKVPLYDLLSKEEASAVTHKKYVTSCICDYYPPKMQTSIDINSHRLG